MLRKISSLTALLSFLLTLLTSVVLYIVPAGRVAYWADWRLWGMTKTEWTNLHVNLGVLFAVAILFHTCFNWNSILAYLKNKNKQFRLLTPAFNISLLLVVVFIMGTYAEIPPFSTINKLSEAIKDNAARFYGEPPYGHAELSSLKAFSRRMGLEPRQSLERLTAAGIVITSEEQSLLEIAAANHTTPQAIYRVIQPDEQKPQGMLPEKAPTGLGKKPLRELCSDYGLNVEDVLKVLARRNMSATEEMSLKQIADATGKEPVAIYQIIRDELASEKRESQ